MEIKQDDHSFYIGDNDNRDAEITFVAKDDEMIMIDHTEVSDKLQGQGVAGKLVEAVVNYARENHLKITASCSYAKHKLEKTEAYHDVYAG
ncbi:GNAT family N-acetyltransferase [Bacillaceae bacterium W0354]